MKNRLSRLLKVLDWYPRSGTPDVEHIASELGTSAATIRRDLRDLRDAGAFDEAPSAPAVAAANDNTSTPSSDAGEGAVAASSAPAVLALVSDAPGPANDNLDPQPTREELLAMYVGARFLASEGDAATADAAREVLARVDQHAANEPGLAPMLAAADVRFRFGPRVAERRLRQVIAQSITERRVLSITYRGERDTAPRTRLVEPLVQYFVHDRWTFLAYCRSANDIRQFRDERCRDVKITDEYFAPRTFSFENFMLQKKKAL